MLEVDVSKFVVAYRCFCTPDSLAETKEQVPRAGSIASYDRKCLHMTEDIARKG
jgi:glutamyl-tRNA synthetase